MIVVRFEPTACRPGSDELVSASDATTERSHPGGDGWEWATELHVAVGQAFACSGELHEMEDRKAACKRYAACQAELAVVRLRHMLQMEPAPQLSLPSTLCVKLSPKLPSTSKRSPKQSPKGGKQSLLSTLCGKLSLKLPSISKRSSKRHAAKGGKQGGKTSAKRGKTTDEEADEADEAD